MSENRLDGSPTEPTKMRNEGESKATVFRLKPPEPWHDAVDGAQLLDELLAAIQRHLSMQTGCAEAVALWTVYTHCFEAMTIAPRLAIVSPEKQCGKTTLLSVIGNLVPKPLHTANITAAAVFRTIELLQPTLSIDEADTFIANSDELRGVLNSGHNKATAYTIRLTGDKHEPKQFSTWAPIAIAAIGTLKDTLMDRSIIIQMRRRLPTEEVERFRADQTQHLDRLCRMSARWARDNLQRIRDADPDMPTELSDRAWDNWRPLLTIAQLAGGSWPNKAVSAMLAINHPNADAEGGSVGIMLLQDLREILTAYTDKNIATEFIIRQLTGNDFLDRPWRTYGKGSPISAKQVSNLLKSFEIKSDTRHFPNGPKLKGYVVEDFKDAFRRYLP